MTDPFNIQAWQGAFSGAVAASAALLGLFFVGFSVRLREIERNPLLGARAAVNLQALALGLSSAVCGLVPQSLVWFAWEILGLLVVYNGVGLLTVWKVRLRLRRRDWFGIALIPISSIPGLACGISLLLKSGPGLYLLAVVFVFGFLNLSYNAWGIVWSSEAGAPHADVREVLQRHRR